MANQEEETYTNINYEDESIKEDAVFKIHGDPVTGNLNPLIFNNILSCQYFKEEVVIKNFCEVVEEIIANVNNIEAWAVGINGIPSTFFCCLYKLILLKLTHKQLNFLCNYENAYVKISGLLYIRYLADPKELWELLASYLSDSSTFYPTVDKKKKITIGEYCEKILQDYDHYGTRLPRIPTPIEREIKEKLILFNERKRRLQININRNSNDFQQGTKCKVLVNNSMTRARIIDTLINDEGKLNGVKVIAEDKEYMVRLEDLEIIEVNNRKRRDRSSSSSSRSKGKERRRKRSRSRSRSKDYKRNEHKE